MHFPSPGHWATLYGVERKGREAYIRVWRRSPSCYPTHDDVCFTEHGNIPLARYASPSPLPSWKLDVASDIKYVWDGWLSRLFFDFQLILVWMFAKINFCPHGFTPRGDNEKSRSARNLMSNDRLLSGYLTTMTTSHLDAQFS